ncbi:hypothetical protein BDZ45DRAFT_234595 [Acephala macrosclerotiorum]|nr:hypothetical protein BDZ45DRAFT_234595 [Acephala macrosclerotiorum]
MSGNDHITCNPILGYDQLKYKNLDFSFLMDPGQKSKTSNMLGFNGPITYPQLAAIQRLQNGRWDELFNLTRQLTFGFLTPFGRYNNDDDYYGYSRDGLPFRDQYGTLRDQHGERIGLRERSSFGCHSHCPHSRSRSRERHWPPSLYSPPGPRSLFGSLKSGLIRVPIRIVKPANQARAPFFPGEQEDSILVSHAASIDNIYGQLADQAGTHDIEAYVKIGYNYEVLLRSFDREDLWDALERGHVQELLVYMCPGVSGR